jgi:hypothetical protein
MNAEWMLLLMYAMLLLLLMMMNDEWYCSCVLVKDVMLLM